MQSTNGGLHPLTPHLLIHEGSARTGVLYNGEHAILFDAGDAAILSVLPTLGIRKVERAFFTHYHRDSVSAAAPLAATGTRLCIPATEQDAFANVERYWNDPAFRWHLYHYHPDPLMLPRSVPVAETCQPGDTFTWGPATITVLSTPGHTDGSVSYQVDVDGQRHIFCGDVLCGDGQIWEAYSLQKGEGLMDYHGFLGARTALAASLQTLRSAGATRLIPSHGPVVNAPAAAIDRLLARLATAYRQYAATSALRHYYPQAFAEFTDPTDMLPIRPGLPAPAFLRHIDTSWIIISETRAAFVMDCGSPAVADSIRALQDSGEIGPVEGLWITHYHDDHVDGIARFRELFDCPVIADPHVADVVEDPLAWRLPCISPLKVRVDRRTRHGERWTWREFTLTAFHLPGQTEYHGGLLCEGRGQRLFFTGDSFTPAGIDDYCTGNRNWLGRGQGLDAAVALLEELAPDLLFNAHIDGAFHLTGEDCAFMRRNLAAREQSFGELFPWDHPNYGLDPHWVRCTPYEQTSRSGGMVHLGIVIHNHSSTPHPATARPLLPPEWNIVLAPQTALCLARADQRLDFSFSIPPHTPPGRWVIPVELTYAERPLGPFREGIIVVS